MPDYTYTAHNRSGQILRGVISAHSKEAALTSLHERELRPFMLEEDKARSGMNMEIPLLTSHKVKSKDLVIFTRQLSTMVNAGVPILRALALLRDQTQSKMLKGVLDGVTADIQGGQSLGEAIGKHPDAFSKIYINMVRAGETGGILDKVLDRLAYQQEKDAQIRGKIKGAMIYPAVIFSVTMFAFFILMTFIVPKIGNILTQLTGGKGQLPIYTRVLLSLSHLMRQPLFLAFLFIGVPVLYVLFRRYIKTPKGRFVWHSLLLRLPVVKTIITKTAIARFSRIFSSLMGAGVSIVDSINTTAGAIGNAVIERELIACSKAVQSGSQLSKELEKSKHFPPIVAQMLAVGEETGKTDEVVIKIAEFYEDEVDTAVGSISSIIEPIMIVVLGGMVGLIVISVFGPITKAETSASGLLFSPVEKLLTLI